MRYCKILVQLLSKIWTHYKISRILIVVLKFEYRP